MSRRCIVCIYNQYVQLCLSVSIQSKLEFFNFISFPHIWFKLVRSNHRHSYRVNRIFCFSKISFLSFPCHLNSFFHSFYFSFQILLFFFLFLGRFDTDRTRNFRFFSFTASVAIRLGRLPFGSHWWSGALMHILWSFHCRISLGTAHLGIIYRLCM